MTHGDKAKAQTGKSSSQASAAAKKSNGPTQQAGGKAVEGKGGGKGAPQSAAKTESGKISIKKAGNGSSAQKGGPASSSGKEGGGKAGKGRDEEPVTFSNPVVASAYRRAIQKYPNAFRKLTD